MIELETILERGNLNRAFKAVVANKGSAGVDDMEVGDLLAYLKAQGADLVKSIKEGRYKPSPVRRVFIPKERTIFFALRDMRGLWRSHPDG